MLFSKSFIFTLREDPKVAESASHKLLLKGSFLFMVSSGIYAYLPLGFRVLDKINAIIRKHMNAKGAQELLLSALQPIELWQKTKRDKDLAEVMFRFNDRKRRDLCLGPTHEEEITEIVRKFVSSYKQPPFILYQIQAKFRDEPRPRYGLMRSCEFIMKDAYSFDIDEKGLDESYAKMFAAYKDIFHECGLDCVITEAESGFMGGSLSHEFMVPAEIGEDTLMHCPHCLSYRKKDLTCPKCGQPLYEKKMIEVGHVFKLGTKYSLAQDAFFLDALGKKKPLIMGCYGIGVSRVLASIAETNCDNKGIVWPKSVCPFDISLIILDEALLSEGFGLKESFEAMNLSVLIDERSETAGVKFNDALLLGNPYIVVMGKNYITHKRIDVEARRTSERLSLTREELFNFINGEYGLS